MLLTALVLIADPAAVHAQQGAGGVRTLRVPVTVAVADALPEGAPFQVLRRVDKDPRDVILLSPTADAAALSEAVEQLILMRQVQGDTATGSGAMRLRRPNKPEGAQVRVRPWAERVVGDANRAAPRLIEGVGTVRAVEIWLPPQRGRQRRS